MRRDPISHTLPCAPAALPPVRSSDLADAWDACRQAALAARPGVPRRFRFAPPGAPPTELLLHDRDAACWAASIDRTAGLQTAHGLSLCLRVLALVDLIARAPWAAALCPPARGPARLHPALLRAAATAELTNEAQFDETRLRAELGPHAPRPCPAQDGTPA